MSSSRSARCAGQSVPMRREPQQDRSRARVEAILEAARAIIVEGGSDAMKMSDVAARAGVPIGSVYQYFPDKPAILRELALRFMARVRTMLEGSLEGLRCRKDAFSKLDAILSDYYRFFIAEPDTRDIWAATQSDKELQALDVEDSRQNGVMLAKALAPLTPKANRQRLSDSCFLLVHLVGAAVRLAIAAGPREGERLMRETRALARSHLEDILS